MLPMFAGRVLAFDLAASQAHAELMAKVRLDWRTIPVSDGNIAAANGLIVNGVLPAGGGGAPFRRRRSRPRHRRVTDTSARSSRPRRTASEEGAGGR